MNSLDSRADVIALRRILMSIGSPFHPPPRYAYLNATAAVLPRLGLRAAGGSTHALLDCTS